MAASAAATTTSNATTTTTTTTSASSGIELSPQPIFQELVTPVSQTPINQTYTEIIFSANGTLNLPNDTETITTTSSGSGILESRTSTIEGIEEILTTEEEGDGSDNATATFYGIVWLDMQEGTGRGIVVVSKTGT
jgi:hypothetical protein